MGVCMLNTYRQIKVPNTEKNNEDYAHVVCTARAVY